MLGIARIENHSYGRANFTCMVHSTKCLFDEGVLSTCTVTCTLAFLMKVFYLCHADAEAFVAKSYPMHLLSFFFFHACTTTGVYLPV